MVLSTTTTKSSSSSTTSSSSSTTRGESCQIILTLAHLLQQHSLSYDDEKNRLLDASVSIAMKFSKANQFYGENAMEEDNGGNSSNVGEVHIMLTGSPRPTFAETNAWLLESRDNKAPPTPRTPRGSMDMRSGSVDAVTTDATNQRGGAIPNLERTASHESHPSEDSLLLHSYLSESTHYNAMTSPNANTNDLMGSPTRTGESILSHVRRRRLSSASSADGMAGVGGVAGVLPGEAAAGGVPSNPNPIILSHDAHFSNNSGPMVGHAVVNAISQTSGIGLHSSRSQLLQGTIDRPLWDQRRWTDGECLFSDLVDRVGLESFENVGAAMGHARVGANVADAADREKGPDVAAGQRPQPPPRQERRPSSLGEAGRPLHKTTNLSAHLITVPAVLPMVRGADCVEHKAIHGMEEETVDEIARGILRCLKRKKSPRVSKMYVVLPPLMHLPRVMSESAMDVEDGEHYVDGGGSGGGGENGGNVECAEIRRRREVVSTRLTQAWNKLERYNDMIGQPKLMADVVMEFVNVSL